MIGIKGRIKEYFITKEENAEQESAVEPKKIERPEVLLSKTYKIKVPISPHAIYITISDDEKGNPFEIFINSKNTEHFQWMVALTRVMSAVMRSTKGNCEFLIEELESVFDPNGGYWKKGKYMNSIVSEIGAVLRLHMNKYKTQNTTTEKAPEVPNEASRPKGKPCSSCGSTNTSLQEGCLKCLDCNYSKCG